jgi:Tfp pilus assembly protein PilV
MISVVIFSAVLLGLAGLAFQVAKRSTRATDQALMMSILLSRVDRASTIEYDSLPNLAGCDTAQSGVVSLIGCTAVNDVSPRLRTVRVVAQTTVAGARPDTIVFQRGKERRPVPLK